VIDKEFLRISIEKLRRSGSRIEDCVGRLNHEQIWTRNADNVNSIGNLVLHLCGNVRQWIGFGIGDLTDQRDRDSEFAARGGLEPKELIERARKTVSDAVDILGNFDSARLMDKVTIQNMEVTKMEAIYQVVEHFAQHTGQIIFVTKKLTGDDLGYFKHLNPGAAAHVP
jgi:uncharacterized damage-inducible protein DinB